MSGYGGLTMMLGHLRTIATLRLPVKPVLFDNGGLGMARWEKLAKGYEVFEVKLKNSDLARLAGAYGIFSRSVDRHDDVTDAFA